jgi:hypothetical protein
VTAVAGLMFRYFEGKLRIRCGRLRASRGRQPSPDSGQPVGNAILALSAALVLGSAVLSTAVASFGGDRIGPLSFCQRPFAARSRG